MFDIEIDGGTICNATQNFESDLGSDDLDTDCAPHIEHRSTHFHAAHFPSKVQGHVSEVFDSGIGDSLKSQDLGKHFQDMQIYDSYNEEPETKCREVNNETRAEPAEYRPTTQEEIVYDQDEEGDTQLHLAIIQKIPVLCLYFINLVPQFYLLNKQNNLMQTPLHLAVMTGMADIVRRLIVAGADITLRDHRGDTPLHIASRNGDKEIVRLLLDPVSYEETLQNSYKIPYQKIPQNLELRNYNGQTCLHVAAEGTFLEALHLLLCKGSNINTMDGKSGRTVLHYAAETNNRHLLEFLLQNYKVKVNARTYGGQTPLMLAQGRTHNAVVQRLMQAGAVFEHPQEDSDSDDDMDESST
ncbi:NF-kappa-B inhibitor alpha-like isoform X2 [Mizuhopecten yessoensis]|uniref:NF-kappa-B inhibitor alpha-like isoform X2 n=1 Tax=Mizuhopecten yessoensis TaxID=6573 RepID=UPI000B45C058|nr:NF-kappa-B inhibitor alpha-like isoform X2 [Mizuhopecten yessoensis]